MTNPEAGVKKLFYEVGRVVVCWAQAEESLDHCIALIHQYLLGRTLKKKIPRVFGNKTKYLKMAFCKISILAPLKERGLSLMGQATTLGEKRNIMVHSVPQAINDDGLEIVLRTTKSDGYFHSVSTVGFTLAEYRLAGDEMWVLATELFQLARDLLELSRAQPRPMRRSPV